MLEPKIKEKYWQKEFEKNIYESWKKEKIYQFNKNSKKKIYSIDTPPPYVNAPVHIGQVTTYILMDMFARFKRMTNHEVLFPLGLDRNGLPIEIAAEKKFNVKMHEVPREEFIEMCKRILEDASLKSTDTFLKCGISFNSWNLGKEIGDVYFTDSPEYRALTQETFIDLWNKKLIYEAERINNYCPGCRTTIADAEIEYEEIPSIFNDIKFKVKETGEEIIISTTRPELISTCAMIIFNPENKKYKHLEGKTAITPIYNKQIPIKSHPLAKLDETTSGLVMMCSFGDTADVQFFREMNLKPIIAINIDGLMNKNAGFLEGLKIKEARKKIIEELKNKNLLVAQKNIVHRTPLCERSKDNIEFILMKEFYLKQLDFKKDIRKISDKINFYSPESKQLLLDWIDSISMDWAISRRRIYATEIPLWYCKKCNEVILPKKGKYYQPWKESPQQKCKCGSSEFIPETRVFDTWFDSSISPLYILKYSSDKFFEKAFPCSLRPQGKEIVRTWLYYTLLKCYLLTNKPVFKDVWINYHIVDDHGNKMSKSKGNMIDPLTIIDKFGAEPLRLWSAIEGDLTKQDFRCSFERIEGASKTLTKLWNISKFISIFPESKKTKLSELDKWIMQELNSLIKETKENYEKYNFHIPAAKLKHFIWETFASHYIEIVKARAYNDSKKFTKQEQQSALYTLHYCLDILLKLLCPITPSITYKIYHDLRKKDIHFEEFPEQIKEEKLSFTTEELAELNSSIWKAKKDLGFSLKTEIKELSMDAKFKIIEKDLKIAHNINKINYGSFNIKL